MDGFQTRTLAQELVDLDVYLLPASTTDLNDAVWLSFSGVDNVEHIFFEVDFAAQYKIVVVNTQYGLLANQSYGLSWWAGESIPGDFDGDGDADGDDLPVWTTAVGTSEADADDDGDTDGNDFLAWQRNVGFGAAAVPATKPVPEPSSLSLCCLGLPLLWLRRRFAVICVGVGIVIAAQPAIAASVTFVRESRPVSIEEIADGAPSGAIVSDFYATTDADILSVVTSLHLPLYKHRKTDDRSPVDPELAVMSPALRASSYLDTPGDTLRLGGGWTTEGEKVWGDLTNDGPQKDFLFGRLTTSAAATFSGHLALRGEWTYVNVPFSFELPGDKGSMSERFAVFEEEPKPPAYDPRTVEVPQVYEPPALRFPQVAPMSWTDMSAAERRAIFLEAFERKHGRSSIPILAETRTVQELTDLAAVPEPSVWVLCSLGALCAARSLRQSEKSLRHDNESTGGGHFLPGFSEDDHRGISAQDRPPGLNRAIRPAF